MPPPERRSPAATTRPGPADDHHTVTAPTDYPEQDAEDVTVDQHAARCLREYRLGRGAA